MLVSAWHGGGNTYGIRIGRANRDAHFRREWKEIEVEIDGILYRFALTDGFWCKCPEFRDRGKPIIKTWLSHLDLLNWPAGKPPKFELKQIENGKFRLTRLSRM